MSRVLAFATLICAFLVAAPRCQAAVSCTLDRPDRDVKRLVKDATTYKVRELLPFRHGDKDVMKRITRELGLPLDPEYETQTTPFTFYVVYDGIKQIALILGTNTRAVSGPMQLFIVYNPNGKIADVYVQRISSPDAPMFRSKFYRGQYVGYGLDYIPDDAHTRPPVRSPTNETLRDHEAFSRAVRFNMLVVKELYNKQAGMADAPTAASGASAK